MAKIYIFGRNDSASITNLIETSRDPLKVEFVEHGTTPNGTPDDLYLNWGLTLSQFVKRYPRGVATYDRPLLNNPVFINNTVDKLATYKILERHNISIPTYYTLESFSLSDYIHPVSGTTYLFRTNFKSRGEGISIKTDPTSQEIRDHLSQRDTFITPYWQHDKVYRLVYFRDKLIYANQTYQRTPDDPKYVPPSQLDINSRLISNHGDNYRTSTIFDLNLVPAHLREGTKNIAHHLQLDFVAIDVLYRKESMDYRVTEVNSAPALSGSVVEKYLNVFNDLANAPSGNL